MEASSISQVAVFTMAFLVLCQGVLIFLIFTKLSSRLRELKPQLGALITQANAATTSLRQLVSHTEGVYEKLSKLQEKGPRYGQQGLEWLRRNDQVVGDALKRARLGLLRFDSMADQVMAGFSRQTFRVHKAIVHPGLRISELLQSGAGLLGRLRQHDRSPASYPSDQEIFI